MAIYKDPILERLKAILNAEGPKDLRGRYFVGDPLVVAKTRLPAAFITRDKTIYSNLSDAEDTATMPVVINLVYDLSRDFNQAYDQLNSASSLYDWAEGRNADYTLRADSIIYVLRKYQELGSQLYINLEQDLEVEYGIGVQKRGAGIFTVEAAIHLVLMHNQIRAGTEDVYMPDNILALDDDDALIIE